MSLDAFRAFVLAFAAHAAKSSKEDIERLIQGSQLRISSLDSQIKSLVEIRDRERACVAALRYLISPIHTLPVELLIEIFKLSIDDVTHIEDAFRISQVCSHWRRTAHNSPRLWTRPLEVDVGKSKKSTRAYADGLKTWLGRSAPLPLDITLLLDSTGVSRRILEEVLRISLRWRALLFDWEGYEPPPLSLVSRLAECRLDSLEELDLGRDAIVRDIDIPDLPSFAAAPNLQVLTICIESNALICGMPWAQLIYLHLECYSSPDDALDILAQCANLESASIRIRGWESDGLAANRDMITLTNLDDLSIPFCGLEEHVTPFFGSLSAPALTTLSLDFSDMQGGLQWTKAYLTEFQLRAPNITRLVFHYGGLTPEDFTTALRYTPSLAELELNACHYFDNTVISALSYEDEVKPLASCLHHLVLSHIHERFTADNLAGMLASRWWTDASELATRLDPPVVRWTYLNFEGFRGQLRDRMAVLQREGLPIRLK
ncbi:F-box domain-containing protein [Mycena sanguinolenta]|uniref:F-box domain-containing protein n=1 Tax=Mycena sanguinolenta TaxID=230812 RepID=A0A8H6YEQ8_9AGAR|nr:F-box domain-containing protein [Mycena sanguinolenta]